MLTTPFHLPSYKLPAEKQEILVAVGQLAECRIHVQIQLFMINPKRTLPGTLVCLFIVCRRRARIKCFLYFYSRE